MRRSAYPAAAFLGLVLAGCGGDDRASVRSTLPAASSSPAATPTAMPNATSGPTVDPTREAPAPPTATPEGGDEAGNRVDVRVTLAPEGVVPRRLEVPAFLGLRLRVRNESGGERIVRLDGSVVVELLPEETQVVELEGLQPGRHVLEAGESGRTSIVAVRPR